jgi:hypothetical protein
MRDGLMICKPYRVVMAQHMLTIPWTVAWREVLKEIRPLTSRSVDKLKVQV